MKFKKFLRTPYFFEHLQWLFLTVSGFQLANLSQNRLPQRCFSVNFAKYLRTSFDRTHPDDSFLRLSVNFLEHLFYTAPLRNYLLHVQVAEFQPVDTVKNFFTGAFQAFYTIARSSHWKAFI